jgi:hypothetical protein
MLDAQLPAALSLLIGIEPETLDTVCPDRLAGVIAKATTQLRVLIELDGSALLANPASMLDTIRRARDARWGIVLRGIAEQPWTAAMLSVVQPDVIALNLGSLRRLGTARAARVLTDCLAYRQCRHVSLLIREVDRPADRREVEAWQPDLLQGELFGALGAAIETTRPPRLAIPLFSAEASAIADDPFQVIAAAAPVHKLEPEQLTTLVRTFQDRCAGLAEPPVVLACQHREFLHTPPRTTEAVPPPQPWCTAVLTSRPTNMPTGEVVCVRLPRTDPLAAQHLFVALNTEFAVALGAQRTTAGGRDDQLDVTVSYRPDPAIAVARALLSRIPDTAPARLGETLRARPAPLPPPPEIDLAAVDKERPKRSGWRRRRSAN